MYRIRITAAIAIAGLLAACGGGDDDDAAATTTAGAVATTEAPATTTSATTEAPAMTAAGTEAPATTEASSEDSGATDTIVVGSLDDMPQECVDILTDMFKAIEPAVEGVDFSEMSMNDFETLNDQITVDTTEFEQQLTDAGCDQYTFEDEDTDPTLMLQQLTELAQEEAPGLVGYFEFLSEQLGAFNTPSSLPTDCDSALEIAEGYIAQGGTMGDLPTTDVVTFSGALGVISSQCDQDTAMEFMSRDDVSAFLGE